MAESVSKLRSEVYGLTNVGGEGGVDIMANEDTFKSTYDILHDISKVWGKMSDINRSALLEKLAGKVRSNQVAALLENFDQAERVLETSQNAKGTMSQVHARWMDSVEARQAQFKAAQETASMAAMPASTLKGLYQAGTTGLGLLTQLMNFAGSGGVGLGAIGTAAALKSGAGNIWAGLGQALNIHKGGFGQKDLINAYNLAYMDNLSPTAGNKQASLQEAQRQTGIKPNKYTNNLVTQTDGAIDAAKATSSLATSLKGLAKNALGAVTTFALIEGASYLAQQAWGWVDKNVIHKNETLAAAADAATAVYKETKQSAEAAAAERDAVKERIVEIEKKRTNGTATKSDIAEAAMLESEVRELEYKASLEERKQLLKARDAFDKKGEQEAGYGATSEMYTLLGDLLEANPQNFGQWVGAIFGNIEQVAKAAGEGIKNAIVGMPTNATSEYAKTMSDTAARDARVASVPQDKRFIVNGQDRTKDAETIYQRMLAFSELQTRFKNVDSMSDAELAANYQLAVQERAAINSQLQSMPSTLLDYLNGRSAYDNFGSFFTYMQAATATRLATSESGLADLFDQYVTLASNNQASESDRQLMQSQMQSSLFLRLSMTDADKLEQATFDFFRNMFSESSYKDVISKMLELAAGGENAESIAETIGKEYSGLSGIMSMLGYSISNLASMAVNRTQDTEQQIHGAAVVEEDPYEKQNANVAALGTAQDLGAKLWKSTGFTGALDPTSKEYQELMAMDGGAYQAAIEHANGTLFFNKDAFDKIVQQKFQQELSDLQKNTADAEMKYAKAAQKLTEQLKFQQEGSDQFDPDARNAAIADLQKYSAQLSGYRAMASQIDYGMSGLANWIANKGGAESGDAYGELGNAAKSLRTGKRTGMVGTREFSAALKFYGREGLTLDEMTSADWNLINALSGVDENGKAVEGLATRTMQRMQRELRDIGVLDENFAIKDTTMTMDEMAAMYNKRYKTNIGGEAIQTLFLGLNDMIYDESKKYAITNGKIANQDPEVVKAQEEFAAAAKAYQEATPEKQAEALAKAAEAGQKYIDAVNKSATTALIGSKDTMTAAQAAIEANQQAQDASQTTAGTDQQAQGGDQQGEKSINEQLLEAVKEMNGNLAEIKTNTAPEKKPPEGEGEGEGETTPETPATASTEQGGRQEEAAGTGTATESGTPPPTEPPKNPAIAAAEAAIAQSDAAREERDKVTSSANAALSNARDVGNAKGVTADRLQNLVDSGEGTTEDIAELTDQLASENDIQGTLLGLERVASEGNLSDETREALVNTINTLRDALGNPEADIEALLKDAASQMTDAWSESEANATQAFVTKLAEDQAKSARQEAVDAAKTLIDKNFDNMPTDGGPLNQAFNALQAAINDPESTNEQIKAMTGQLSKALYDQQMAYQKQQAEREASLKSGTTGSQTDQRIAEERAKAEKRRAEAEAAAARAADKAAADQVANDFIDQYEDQFNQMQLGGPLDEAYTALVAGIANPDLTGEQVNALKDQLAARLAEQQEYDDAIAVSKAYETKKQEQQKRDEEAAKAAAAAEAQKKAAIAAALAEDEEEMRQEYLEQYSEASDRAKTSGAYQGPGRAALDKAIDKIGEAFDSGDWNAFKQAVADLDNLMTAVDAADQERGEREARDESDAENAAALRARAEQRRQDAIARAREESAYMDQFNDELAEETEKQKEASARQEIEQFIADNGLVGVEAEDYELAVNAAASQEDLAHRQGPITPMNVEQPENEEPQVQLAGVAGQFLTWTGGELAKEFTSFLQDFTGQTEESSVPDTIVAVPITEDTQVSAAEQPELTIGLKAAQAQQAELDRIAAETDKMLTREIGERNIISGKQMQEAGWTDVPEDDYATLYSQTFTGNGKTVLASPITPSGEILSPEEFQAYIGELLESDLGDIFANDTRGLLLGAMNGANDFTIARMGAYGQQLSMQQQRLYGPGTGMGAGVATPAPSAAQNQTLDDLYDQAELLTAAITTYLAQNGYDGNETLWAKGQELNNALRQGNDANIGKLVKASDELIRAQLEQQGMTLEQFVETQGLLEKGFSSVVEASGSTESQTLTKAGQTGENAQQGVDVGVNYDVPEIEIPQPDDVQVGVEADTSGAQAAIDSIDGGSIEVEVVYSAGKMPSPGGEDQGGGGSQFSDVQQAATGTKNASNGPYLVDERGQELIEHVSKGTYELGTNDGPRFTRLDAGDIVHTAKETRKILRRGKAMANGGKVTTGFAYGGTNSTGSSGTAAGNQSQSTQHIDWKLINYANQQQQWNNRDPGPQETFLASGTQILKFLQNTFDWIPTFLSVLKKKTTEFINAADDAIHYLSKNKMIDSAIGNVADEIQANLMAALRYREFLVGMTFKGNLPMEIIHQIQNGTLDIQKYKETAETRNGGQDALLKAIQAYQEYWNKLVACQDALKGLNDQMEALSKQKMDNIIHYFDQIDDLLSQQQKSYESLMDLKKQYGQEISVDDYTDSLKALEAMLDNTQNEENAVVAELSDQLGVGEDIVRALLDGGKEVWEAIAAHVQKATDAGIADLTEGLATQNAALAEGIENGTVPNYWATMYGQRSLIDPNYGVSNESIFDAMNEDAKRVNNILLNAGLTRNNNTIAEDKMVGGTYATETQPVAMPTNVSPEDLANRKYGLPVLMVDENGAVSKLTRVTEIPDPEDIFPLTMPVEPEVEPPTDEDIRAVGEMLGLNMADESEEALANFELVKSLFTTTWDNPLAIGSETWYSYMATLEELRGNIYSTKVEISEMNDEIAKIPLTNLQTGFDYLEDIMDNLEGINDLLDAQGAQKSSGTYESMISVGMKQIENLEEQNKLIEEQMSLLDPLSEKYQELRDDLNNNLDSIADIRENQERWNDAIIDLQIDRLRKQNDKYKEQLSLMRALDDLENARQRRILTYHDATGFVYEADEDAMESAQESAIDAMTSSMINALENQKEISNIYGPLGERLIQGSSIVDSLGNILVPVEDKLSGLDFGSYYQSILDGAEQTGLLTSLLNSIDMTKLLESAIRENNISIDLSGMTLNEVNDVKDLCDAIMQQLPNYLLQAMYQKGA